jgi:thioredoxin reductase
LYMEDFMNRADLPVAVIGAGPVGLAAAAHLLEQGETPIIFEAGDSVGANMLQWGHVRLFSPWRYCVDKAALRLLETTSWRTPDPEALPTGAELVHQYLEPLAAIPELKPHIRLHQRVISITRAGFDKLKTAGRDASPFLLQVVTASGDERQVLAKAVIDASGTYGLPNPLGASGIPAIGERALKHHIFYGIPDILGRDRDRYAGKKVLVVGSGHSAFNALLELAELANEELETRITWAVRRGDVSQSYGGGDSDGLPARGALGTRLRHLVESGLVRLVTGFRISRLMASSEGIVVSSDDIALDSVDEIIVTTGFRPDLTLFQELRVALDTSLESPPALAPLIDPNVHSCGSVPPHGAEQLAHPEQDFYVVGMKSYGRAPTFLLLTGYEQVRSVAAAIAGDWESARQVQLELPETGVCSTDLGDSTGAACCGTESPVKQSALIQLSDIPINQVALIGAAQNTSSNNGSCCG